MTRDLSSLRCTPQGAVLVARKRHRLLNQDVLAGLGRRDALRCVDLVRAADVHDVHGRVGQHFVKVVPHGTVEFELVDQPLGALPPGPSLICRFDASILEL